MGPSEARSAEHSKSDFVCPGMSGRDWCGGPWHAGPSQRRLVTRHVTIVGQSDSSLRMTMADQKSRVSAENPRFCPVSCLFIK